MSRRNSSWKRGRAEAGRRTYSFRDPLYSVKAIQREREFNRSRRQNMEELTRVVFEKFPGLSAKCRSVGDSVEYLKAYYPIGKCDFAIAFSDNGVTPQFLGLGYDVLDTLMGLSADFEFPFEKFAVSTRNLPMNLSEFSEAQASSGQIRYACRQQTLDEAAPLLKAMEANLIARKAA